jgi:hypothetical protein
MPSPTEVEARKRRNGAVRDADRKRPMSELLEETARLSRVVSELRAGVERAPDVDPLDLIDALAMKRTAGREQDLIDLRSLGVADLDAP